MDSPFEALPVTMPRETKRKLFSQNAAKLYGIDVEAQALS
jgi:hypothetical protein